MAESKKIEDKEKPSLINLSLSASLRKRVTLQAEEEGISVEDYVAELVGEGVVVRAWEIAERKAQMRNPNSQQGQQNQNRNHRGGNRPPSRGNSSGGASGGRNPNARRGRQNLNNVLEDGPQFLEYVRNQERRQGR